MKNLWIPKTMRNEGFKFKALSRRPSPKRKFIFQPLCVQEQAVTCQGCNRLGGFHLTLGEVRVGSDWGSLKQVSNIFVSMDNNFPTKRGWQWHRGKKSVENIAFRNNGNWKVIWYTPRKFVKTEYNYPKLPYSKRHRLSQILMFAIYIRYPGYDKRAGIYRLPSFLCSFHGSEKRKLMHIGQWALPRFSCSNPFWNRNLKGFT